MNTVPAIKENLNPLSYGEKHGNRQAIIVLERKLNSTSGSLGNSK